MAAILFLVLGDMVAAIVGVSFGGDALGKLKLGREGKKSLEGSLAMFFVCFFVGSTIFAHVRLVPPLGLEACSVASFSPHWRDNTLTTLRVRLCC